MKSESDVTGILAVGYARVSTEEQEISIEVQKDRLQAYAALRGLQMDHVIEDNGVSSGVPLAKRPGGQNISQLVKQKKIGAVVILKLDRAFRNTIECLSTVEDWEKRGIALHIVDMGGNAIDTTTATGKFTLTILAGVAEMERNQIRERTRAAMGHLKAKGRRVSGRIPFGYDLARDGQSLRKNRTEQFFIGQMQMLRESGHTLQSIANHLIRQGVRSKSGAPWSPKVIRGILKRMEL